MAHTIKEVQTALKAIGFDPGDIDGEGGPKTAAAVAAFQKAKNLPETGRLDPATLSKLFPAIREPVGSRTIQATVMDWVLNYAQSRIVWVAGVLLAAVIAWLNTRFGITVSPEIENAVTALIVTAGTAIIAVLRGWGKDTPRVSTTTPVVIQKPGEPTK